MSKVQKLQQKFEFQDSTLLSEGAKHVLSSPSGRHFVWRMLAELGFGGIISSPEPLTMAGNSAKHDSAQWMVDLLVRIDPDLYLQMQKEKFYEQRERYQQLKSASDDDRRLADRPQYNPDLDPDI